MTHALSRRSFVGAGIAAAAFPVAARAGVKKVVETDVKVITPDGAAEAVLCVPKGGGQWPALLLWPDILGIRPPFREIARRFAGAGFVVLMPNAFYRTMRPSDAEVNPWDPAIRPKLMEHRAAATDEGIARDAAAYLAFLDAQKHVAKGKKAGTLGYDLGGSYAFRTAAALPGRVAAVGSVYGLGVATARPNSPHLLVPKTNAAYYVAISQDDDAREPEDKDDIRKAIAEGGLKGTVEVYPAKHGWAVPGTPNYDAAATDRSFAELVKLFKAALV